MNKIKADRSNPGTLFLYEIPSLFMTHLRLTKVTWFGPAKWANQFTW